MPKFPAIPWSDLLPPVLVKEARQLTRSKLLVTVIWLELFGLAFFTSATLMWNMWQEEEIDAGLPFFLTLVKVLAGAIACGTLDTMLRTLAERSESVNELIYASGLSSNRILRGKFWAGVSVNLLILSLGLPFLSLSYLLRGVSLTTLVLGCVYLVALAILLVPLAMTLALIPIPNLLKKFGGGFCLVAGVIAVGEPACEILGEQMDGHWQDWLCWFGFVAGILLLLNSMARYLLTRSVLDRSWRPRLLALAIAGAWLTLLVWYSLTTCTPAVMRGHGPSAQFMSILLTGVILFHALPVLVIIQSLLTPAVLTANWRRPKRIPARWCFPLLEGSWNGMAVAIGLAGLAILATLALILFLFLNYAADISMLFYYLATAPVFFGYLFCYALTARFFGDWLRRRGRTSLTSLHLFSIMLAVAGLVTGVALAFLHSDMFGGYYGQRSEDWVLVGDVFGFFCHNQCCASSLLVHAVVVLIWSLPLLRWGQRCYASQRPITPLRTKPATATPKSVLSWRISFSDITRIWQDIPSGSPTRRLVPEWVLRLAGLASPRLVQRFHLPSWLRLRLVDTNPILIKELRQMARSRFPGIVIRLEVIALTAAAMIGFAGILGNGDSEHDLLQMFLTIPVLAMLAMSLEQFNRIARECDSTATDLLFITALTPQQIVQGKFSAAIVPMSLMLVPMIPCLLIIPWLYICPGMQTCLIAVFLVAMASLLAAAVVPLALLEVPLAVKRYLFEPLLVALVVGLTSFYVDVLWDLRTTNDNLSILNGACDVIGWLCLIGLAVLTLLIFARFLAASAISDRSRWLRIQLLGIVLAWYAIGILLALRWRWTKDGQDILITSNFGLFLMPFLALFAALLCPRPLAPALSPGQTRWRRFCDFLFREGTGNGIAYAAGLALLAAATIHLWGMAAHRILGLTCQNVYQPYRYSQSSWCLQESSIGNLHAIKICIIGLGYLFCYALTARLVGDWMERHKEENPIFKPSMLLLVALAVAGTGSLFLMLMEKGIGSSMESLMPINVFAWLWPDQQRDWFGWHMATIAVWLAICLWRARRWRHE
jgi:hypothetical protein